VHKTGKPVQPQNTLRFFTVDTDEDKKTFRLTEKSPEMRKCPPGIQFRRANTTPKERNAKMMAEINEEEEGANTAPKELN